MISLALLLAPGSPDPIPGTWEGTSLCQVKPSPCHDEHVVYRVRGTGRGRYRIAGYKVVSGQEQFMGNVDIAVDPKTGALLGTTLDRSGRSSSWTFVRRGNHLSGRLISDGALFRLIEVTKR
jgi:hypothetical protein